MAERRGPTVAAAKTPCRATATRPDDDFQQWSLAWLFLSASWGTPWNTPYVVTRYPPSTTYSPVQQCRRSAVLVPIDGWLAGRLSPSWRPSAPQCPPVPPQYMPRCQVWSGRYSVLPSGLVQPGLVWRQAPALEGAGVGAGAGNRQH